MGDTAQLLKECHAIVWHTWRVRNMQPPEPSVCLLRAFSALGEAVETDLDGHDADWWLSSCASWLLTAIGPEDCIPAEMRAGRGQSQGWDEYVSRMGMAVYLVVNATNEWATDGGLFEGLLLVRRIAERPNMPLRDQLLVRLGRVYVAKDDWSISPELRTEADRAMREHYQRYEGTENV